MSDQLENYDIQENSHENQGSVRRLRNSYTKRQKKTALTALERNMGKSNPYATTAKELGIDRKLLSKWYKARTSILSSEASDNSRRLGSGRNLKYDFEDEVVDWILDQRSLELPVSNNTIAGYAMGTHIGSFSSFKTALSWSYRMLARNGLSIRRKTTDSKEGYSETEMGEIKLDFVYHIREMISEHSLSLYKVVNMDETGVYFVNGRSTTVASKGTKQVKVKAAKNDSHCTVFLSVALDGSKLKPLVVFKGEKDGTIANRFSNNAGIDKRVECCCQPKAYCDSDIMKIWNEKCLGPYMQNHPNELGLLMMDNYGPHTVSDIRKGIAKTKTAVVQLPPNMTSSVQILDVGVNKPFKDYMKGFYEQELIRQRGQMKVTREMMTHWIADSWEKVTVQTITNTCRSIGFIGWFITFELTLELAPHSRCFYVSPTLN